MSCYDVMKCGKNVKKLVRKIEICFYFNIRCVRIHTFWHDIETLFLIVFAERCVLSHNSNIFPFSWVPIWVVVTLFGALVSVSISVRVLSGFS